MNPCLWMHILGCSFWAPKPPRLRLNSSKQAIILWSTRGSFAFSQPNELSQLWRYMQTGKLWATPKPCIDSTAVSWKHGLVNKLARDPTKPATKRGFLISCFVTSAVARFANLGFSGSLVTPPWPTGVFCCGSKATPRFLIWTTYFFMNK